LEENNCVKPLNIRKMMMKDRTSRNPRDVVLIANVKWREQYGDPQFFPCADTDQFHRLVGKNRGLLVFIPHPEDHHAERDMFSDVAWNQEQLVNYALMALHGRKCGQELGKEPPGDTLDDETIEKFNALSALAANNYRRLKAAGDPRADEVDKLLSRS